MAATQYARGDLDEAETEALRTLLFRLADDEFVAAERLTEWQVVAPSLESDLAISNIAQDEYGHARLWYDLLEDFGDTESELIWEREPADFRHATLVELPVEDGEWADTILRSYLYDEAEALRLDALADSSYGPLADRVEKVQSEERYHRDHARNWLERLADDDPGRERVQAALDRLFPYALTLFEPVDEDVEAAIEEFGFRTAGLDELREQWFEVVEPYLESLGLELPTAELPEQYDVHHFLSDLPEEVGRDGGHTDAWFDLHEELTRTYRDLDRHDTARIMEDPE